MKDTSLEVVGKEDYMGLQKYTVMATALGYHKNWMVGPCCRRPLTSWNTEHRESRIGIHLEASSLIMKVSV